MNLRFTLRAVQDLKAIADYVGKRDPAASVRVRAAILDSLQILTLFPELGRLQSVEGVRKLTTRRYAYLVYYRLDRDSDEIIVLTIQHPAREREYGDI